MPDDGCMKGPPPELWYDYHRNKSLRGVKVAVGISLTSALLFYIFHNRRRINRYRDFYENYDAEKSFERMLEANVFSSCSKEPPCDPKKKKCDDKKK